MPAGHRQSNYSRDPAVWTAPRPFPFDPPTRLPTETTEQRRRPISGVHTISQAPASRRSLSNLSGVAVLGTLGLAVVLGFALVMHGGGRGERSSLAQSAPPKQLREFDIDQGSSADPFRSNVAARHASVKSASVVPLADAKRGMAQVPRTQTYGEMFAHAAESESKVVREAARGEDGALLQIELKDSRERTFEDAIALAEGREVQAQREAKELAHRFILMDPQAPDYALIQDLLQAAGDPYAYREAQLGFAEHQSDLGLEMLFQVTRRYTKDQAISEFAQMLLASEAVYRRASPALRVAIDAFDVNDCGGARKLLRRAMKVADNRAVRPLSKFAQTIGCGENGAEDCYPCLREDELLGDALRAAQRRSPQR